MLSMIRFVKPNRYGRQIGSLDSDLGGGVHETLVLRGFAEFVHQVAGPAMLPAGEPEAIPYTVPRRKRRHNHEEIVQ